MTRAGVAGLALAAVVLALTVLAGAALLHHGASGVTLKGRWLAVAVLTLLCGHLSYLLRTVSSPGFMAVWPIFVGVVAWAGLLLASSLAGAEPAGMTTLAVGTAVVALLMESVTRMLERLGANPLAAMGTVLVLVAAAALVPVWLGPLVEAFAANAAVTGVVVSASPLSYLAALAQYDYLREQWFYVHSPMGSLRFEYPAGVSTSLVYVALAGLCMLLPRRVRSQSGAHDDTTKVKEGEGR